MSFLNETQRFQLGTLLKGAARIHGFADVPEWWGKTAQPEATALKQFDEDYREFNLNTVFKVGLGGEISKNEKHECLFRSLWLQKATDEIQEHFTQHKIRFTFIKGIAQDAKYWHQNPARIFLDIDLWVHPDDLAASVKIASELKYRPVGQAKNKTYTNHLFPNEFHRNDHDAITSLDIHPLPFDGFRKPHVWDNVWPRVLVLDTPVGQRNVLPPEDEIIFWAGNQLKSLFGAWPKACLDIYVMAQKENINWDALVKKAQDAQLVWPTWALLYALKAADVAIPNHCLEALSPPRFITRKMIGFLQNPNKINRTFTDGLQRFFWVLILSADHHSAFRFGAHWMPKRLADKIKARL